MKYAIVYSSRTGNTRQLAEKAFEVLGEREGGECVYLEKYRPDRLREQPHSGSGKPKYCMRGFGPTKEMQTAVYSVYLKSWGRRIICRRRSFCSALPALVRIRPIMTGLFRLLPVSFRNPSN